MKKIVVFLLIGLLIMPSCRLRKNVQKKDIKIETVTLFGNSIVSHDVAPNIGWNGDWGMAASCPDSDYVHRVETALKGISEDIVVNWENIADFERNYKNFDFAVFDTLRKSDLVIVKISENVKYEDGMESLFVDRYDKLIEKISNDSSRIVVVGGFWPTPVNDMIRTYAESKGFPYIGLSDLFENDKSNVAIGLFENEGVANHPSDKGMRNISSRILEEISKYNYQ